MEEFENLKLGIIDRFTASGETEPDYEAMARFIKYSQDQRMADELDVRAAIAVLHEATIVGDYSPETLGRAR